MHNLYILESVKSIIIEHIGTKSNRYLWVCQLHLCKQLIVVHRSARNVTEIGKLIQDDLTEESMHAHLSQGITSNYCYN